MRWTGHNDPLDVRLDNAAVIDMVPDHGVYEILEVSHRNRIIALGIEAARARVKSEPPLQILLHSSLHQDKSRQNRHLCLGQLTWHNYSK